MPTATQTCVNPDCAKSLSAGARFCPFCAAVQSGTPGSTNSQTADPGYAPDPAASAPQPPPPAARPASGGASAPHYRYATATHYGDVLVLRASEKIWHFEEGEGTPQPGQKRPWLVIDEQVTHLAHTDRTLTPDELLTRVRTLLKEDAVPIDVALSSTRWLSDRSEARPRLIASLRGHAYSDIKMLLGVDYLGRWASIHLGLAVEPEPLPAPPLPASPPAPPGYRPSVLALILLIGGLIAAIVGNTIGSRTYYFDSMHGVWAFLGGAGVVSLIGGIIGLIVSATNHGNRVADQRIAWERDQQQKAAQWAHEQHQRSQEKTAERMARTFKVDDMRLFSTAMRQVFQSVVDDIVSQGGEVARIEGGQGGFFQSQGVAQAVPTSRHSDAAQAGV